MPETMAQLLARYTNARLDKETSPFATPMDGFVVMRSDEPKPPTHRIFRPALCVVAQGAKTAVLGDRVLSYHAGKALLVSVEIPAIGRVVQASAKEPFLGLAIELDLAVLRDVMDHLDNPPAPSTEPGGSLCVIDCHGPLEDCVLRMVQLLETPRAVSILYPSMMRELCYWLLTGPHGGHLAKVALGKGHTHRVVSAIHFLRDRFAEAIRVEALAAIAKMSPSAFHRQFKALTSMSPLQYQKRLRLVEARRLMVAEAANVETAAFTVGYESASQFSREYSRMFGASPRRDVAGLRTVAA